MEWRWAVNFFWMAYCGSDPEFPSRSMDPRFPWQSNIVPLAGEYLRGKLGRSAIGLPIRHEVNAMRHALLGQWLEHRDVWIIRGLSKQEFEEFGQYY